MSETPEKILSERDFLWKKCNWLYNTITHNGALNSQTFRRAIGIAGNLFKGKGVDMQHSNSWFAAIADFLEMVETARSQKVGT
jgi:hypothetical protein